MSSLPQGLLVGGFLAGYIVVGVVHWVIAPRAPFELEDVLVVSATYVALIGATLSVPWVLLPVIASEPRRHRRAIMTGLAGLLPAAVGMGGITCSLLGWDVTPTAKVAICLSIAAWFIPTIAALAYTLARGTSLPADESKQANHLMVWITCVVAPLVVGALAMPILAVGGWVTRTESPSAQQVAHAREFLLIAPGLEIEPRAYYLKRGMDHMVRFKFIAKTPDPAQIFDRSQIDPSTFQANFDFPPGEETHHEAWWDISSRALVGGRFRAPNGPPHLDVGYAQNDDRTTTVYAWRHE